MRRAMSRTPLVPPRATPGTPSLPGSLTIFTSSAESCTQLEALTTKEGIILIDTIYPYNSEELIIGGMKKLGLDPRNIKYVIISHAHVDHIGGAEMLQTRYGARVVMGGPDWGLVEK